jgi:hypothetical protein
MTVLLLVFSILAFGAGRLLAVLRLTNPLQEIAALICFLASAVLFVGAAIVWAIGDLRHDLRLKSGAQRSVAPHQ